MASASRRRPRSLRWAGERVVTTLQQINAWRLYTRLADRAQAVADALANVGLSQGDVPQLVEHYRDQAAEALAAAAAAERKAKRKAKAA